MLCGRQLTGNVHDLGSLEDPAGESRILGPASQLPAVVVLAEDQGQLADRGIAPLRGGHVRVAYHLPAQPPHHPRRGRAPPRLATRRDRPIRVDLLLRKNDLHERRFHWKPEKSPHLRPNYYTHEGGWKKLETESPRK